MTSGELRIINLLESIDRSLQALVARAVPPSGATPPPVSVNLDDQYGNPILKAKDPREWTGQTQVGKRMSDCPADYLDLLAARYDYFSERQADPKKAHHNRLDAARCRGWAVRIRAGWKPPAEEVTPTWEPEAGSGW